MCSSDLIDELSGYASVVPGRWKEDLSRDRFSPETKKDAGIWLDSLKVIYSDFLKQADRLETEVTDQLEDKLGKDGPVKLRDDHENKWLRNLVLGHDRKGKELMEETDRKVIRKFEPAYMKATSGWGRAHFYAPVKRIGNLEIDTYWFNMAVIWTGSVILFLVLYFNLIRKLLEYFENLRLPKAEV
mgnify:FL=1